MEWCESMPKIELHAHLNGSIRDSTLLELARALGDKGVIDFSQVEHVILKNDRSLSEVFKLFDLIHIVTTDHSSITRITKEVVEDFASENVVYLELRTTPKVMLALEMRQFGVVGIDLSGNPAVGDWITYLPALRFAREQGLYVTLHCGEVSNSKEIHDMLDFLPQRIGHACFFEEEHWKRLKSSNIPVEICLTSNIRTLSVPTIDAHHFADLYKAKHPLVLCTDDSGVFSTSLSNEYKIAADSFGLGRKQMFELSKNAVEFTFADNVVKEDLRKTFNSGAENLEL
ncbi:adenosine deaminase-like protein isoform X2 [Cajanus cajan]|uniref:adenosine deaminase-like protein isoform X2 n=1 Tax=Cajanus cajan TaxID=3821 RepID=UPI00098D7C51|nr:adenosine deaminase-like protein isoform X2 [Cajanus cajan]